MSIRGTFRTFGDSLREVIARVTNHDKRCPRCASMDTKPLPDETVYRCACGELFFPLGKNTCCPCGSNETVKADLALYRCSKCCTDFAPIARCPKCACNASAEIGSAESSRGERMLLRCLQCNHGFDNGDGATSWFDKTGGRRGNWQARAPYTEGVVNSRTPQDEIEASSPPPPSPSGTGPRVRSVRATRRGQLGDVH